MPIASLGKTYAEFMSNEKISADGLVGASELGSRPQDPVNRPPKIRSACARYA